MNSKSATDVRVGAARAEGDPLRQQLANHPFFSGMNPGHVVACAEYATATKFVAGQWIFHESDPANCFYLILDGCVALEAGMGGAKVQTIDHVGSGEVLGWSWLFPPYRWHFAARALTPTQALFFYGTWLRERCESDPELGHELLKRMAAVMLRRLQTTRQRLARALGPAAG